MKRWYLRGELQCDFVHTLLAAVAQIQHLRMRIGSVCVFARILDWRVVVGVGVD
jgi:hypothetical protein